MAKSIDNIVSFPVNAQRNSFFGALSSILLYRNHYTEDSPFFCGKYQRSCIRCGGCGDDLFIHKHHLGIYQYLITVTGCAYFWVDQEIGNSYEKQYIAGEFSETALDRLSLALQVSGYHYDSMQKGTEEKVLFDRIKQSIEDKRPVLIKLGLGDLWAVITGYDEEKKLPCLMKFRHSPQPNKDWYHKLSNLVFITDKYDSPISLPEALDHMIRHLNTGSRNKLEQKIIQKLEAEADGKKLGMWLNRLNGLAIETRWHASECYRNTLAPMSDSERYKKLLLQAADLHLRFHDQAWQVWALLGVTPQTHYCIPGNINELLDKPSARAELKALFQELFAIDRQVSELLQECFNLVRDESNQLFK